MSFVNSFAVWLGRIPCGDNAESRQNWHVLALGSPLLWHTPSNKDELVGRMLDVQVNDNRMSFSVADDPAVACGTFA